jgi:putative oxidoreductase
MWCLQGIVAVALFAAGIMKLIGAQSEVQLFAQSWIGQWFRILTGVVQIAGAFGLVEPGFVSAAYGRGRPWLAWS